MPAPSRASVDCIEKEMTQNDVEQIAALLDRAEIAADAIRFRHYGSAAAFIISTSTTLPNIDDDYSFAKALCHFFSRSHRRDRARCR